MKILLFTLLFSVSAFAQTQTCNLSLVDSPTIRGLKLGMTKQDVEKVLPDLKINSYANFFLTNDLAKVKEFDDVRTLSLAFIPENSVNTFTIEYKNLIKWNSISEFAKNISTSLNLPFEAWVLYDDQANMRCQGFKVYIRENYINIRSTEIEDKEKENNEKKKKVFKP